MDGSSSLQVPNKAAPQSKPGSGTGLDRVREGAGLLFLPLPLTRATGSYLGKLGEVKGMQEWLRSSYQTHPPANNYAI